MTPSRSAKCCKYEYSVRENESLDLLIFYKVAIKYSFYERNRDVLLRGKSLFNRDDFVQLGDIRSQGCFSRAVSMVIRYA